MPKNMNQFSDTKVTFGYQGKYLLGCTICITCKANTHHGINIAVYIADELEVLIDVYNLNVMRILERAIYAIELNLAYLQSVAEMRIILHMYPTSNYQ